MPPKLIELTPKHQAHLRKFCKEGLSWVDIKDRAAKELGLHYSVASWARIAERCGIVKQSAPPRKRGTFAWTTVRKNRLLALTRKHGFTVAMRKFITENKDKGVTRNSCERILNRMGVFSGHGNATTRTSEERLMLSLRHGFKTLPEHANSAGVSTEEAYGMLDVFVKKRMFVGWDGVRVRISNKPQLALTSSVISLDHLGGAEFLCGAIGDTHLCSKYERLDALNAFYDKCKAEGVRHIFHTGNTIDGYKESLNMGAVYHVEFEAQSEYFVENYPHRTGITTHFITGMCHEGWYAKKIALDVGMRMQDDALRAGRTDLKYLGCLEHDVLLGGAGGPRVRLSHPSGSQTAYALSYKLQKTIESLTGGEKPAMYLCGHYHKAFYMDYRSIQAFCTGCFQDQTPFLKGKGIQVTVGGWIINIQLDPSSAAISQVTPRWIKFYDRAYYQLPWSVTWGRSRNLEPVESSGEK